MSVARRIAASLLVCLGVLVVAFATPAMAQKRGKAADFAGVWETTIPDVNAHYQITLSVNGRTVTGYFTNQEDGQYNGTLTGTVDSSLDGTPSGGRLDYVYLQPAIKAAGRGHFIVSDQGTMAGFVQSEGDSTRYGWEGKRVGSGQSATRGKASDFEGGWYTEVPEFDVHYKLILEVDGRDVKGAFVGDPDDERYTGYLTGTVDPSLDGTPSGGRLDYTYVQPKIGAKGGGFFIVASDGTIAGFTFNDDDPGKEYVWQGRRGGAEIGVMTRPKPDQPGTTTKGVRIVADVTGYDKAGGGPDKCYLQAGDEANLLGSDEGDPSWKHLQGQDICGGDDFWIYDDGKLANL